MRSGFGREALASIPKAFDDSDGYAGVINLGVKVA